MSEWTEGLDCSNCPDNLALGGICGTGNEGEGNTRCSSTPKQLIIQLQKADRKIIALVQSNADLVTALEDAIETIRLWHNTDMQIEDAKRAWDIYSRCAPEMKRLNQAIAKAKEIKCV